MTPEEKLAYNAQLGREQYQAKQVQRQQIRDRQIPSLQVQSWDTAHQAYRATTPDGTVRYVEPLTNGAIAAGDAVRSGRNRIDGMPAPKVKSEVAPIIPVAFDFYVGFDRYITKARDTGMRSLPIKTFFEDIDQYSGAEPGFVSSRDRFIYSVGSDLKTIYKINTNTLASEVILNITASYPGHLFTSLCMGRNNTLFGAFRKNANDGYLYRRTNDGVESFFFLDTGGTNWSIATLDNASVYLVTDYAQVNRFDISTQTLTSIRPFSSPGVSESTFLFADDQRRKLYLFGLLDTLPRGQSVIWEITSGGILEHYRFSTEDGSGNLSRFYGLPSRSAIADAKTKTIFMLGVDTIYTNDGGLGTTISNTNKIVRIDRNKRRTDFNLRFDDPTIESRFDFFGQLDWIY